MIGILLITSRIYYICIYYTDGWIEVVMHACYHIFYFNAKLADRGITKPEHVHYILYCYKFDLTTDFLMRCPYCATCSTYSFCSKSHLASVFA